MQREGRAEHGQTRAAGRVDSGCGAPGWCCSWALTTDYWSRPTSPFSVRHFEPPVEVLPPGTGPPTRCHAAGDTESLRAEEWGAGAGIYSASYLDMQVQNVQRCICGAGACLCGPPFKVDMSQT